jgi:hypothetical protein
MLNAQCDVEAEKEQSIYKADWCVLRLVYRYYTGLEQITWKILVSWCTLLSKFVNKTFYPEAKILSDPSSDNFPLFQLWEFSGSIYYFRRQFKAFAR